MGAGQAGSVGSVGPKGDKGDIGPKGDAGPIGETTWSSFNDVQKTDLINKLKAYKEFVGPVGPKGEPGLQGPVGPMGTMGSVGPVGETTWGSFTESQKAELINRLKGFKEFIGPKGDTGLQGLQGLVGPMGPTGTMGSVGPMGTMGSIGPKGLDGVSDANQVATLLTQNVPFINSLGGSIARSSTTLSSNVATEFINNATARGQIVSNLMLRPDFVSGISSTLNSNHGVVLSENIARVMSNDPKTNTMFANSVMSNKGFLDTLSSTLTSNEQYRSRLVGPPGDMADEVSLKSALITKTMWCADGEFCNVPMGKKGIAFGSGNSISGSSDANSLVLRGKDSVKVEQKLCIGDTCIDESGLKFVMSKFMNDISHLMYLPNVIGINEDIYDAVSKNVFVKVGNPVTNVELTKDKKWGSMEVALLMIGSVTAAEPDTNGFEVVIPAGGVEVVWVRVVSDRVSWIRAISLDKTNPNSVVTRSSLNFLNYRYNNNMGYTPDGGDADTFQPLHQWMPIPITTRDKVTHVRLVSKGGTSSGVWVSGIAFTKNPWGHARNPHAAYFWNINRRGGDANFINNGIASILAAPTTVTGVFNDGNADSQVIPTGNSLYFRNDFILQLNENATYEFDVPIVNNGMDKLLYFVIHDDGWNSATYSSLEVNSNDVWTGVERMRSTYTNPFSRHFTGRGNRYMASLVRRNLIRAGDNILRVRVRTPIRTPIEGGMFRMYIREIGTHDYRPDM